MKIVKPARLEKGMTIGLIAPASAVKDVNVIDTGIRCLEKMGFSVIEGKHTRKKLGYLGSTDKDRADDLHKMFKNRKVDAIMCLRGGYGTPRLIPLLDDDIIRRNPKVFIGFSDITMLHLAFLRRYGLVSFNGPMLAFTFAQQCPDPFTVSGFERTVMAAKPAGSIWQMHNDHDFRVVRHGKASGLLTGGNLSLVAASVGTEDEIQTRNRIVFLEEVDEKPYRVDRMLTQLINAGLLQTARAVVFGRNVADEESAKLEEERKSMDEKNVKPLPSKVTREFEPIIDDIIADRLKPLGIPVMIGLPFGHIEAHATLPLGVRATVDTKSGELVIEEAAVS